MRFQSCGAVSVPLYNYLRPADIDFFKLLNIEQRFDVDPREVDKNYAALQKRLHPDMFMNAAETEAKYAADHSLKLAEASATIRDPIKRAKHFIFISYGVQCLEDDERVQNVELMTEVLEAAERIDEANSEEEIDALKAEYDAKIAQDTRELFELFKKEDFETIRVCLQTLQLHHNIYTRILNWDKPEQR